jgi:hypothetical protein
MVGVPTQPRRSFIDSQAYCGRYGDVLERNCVGVLGRTNPSARLTLFCEAKETQEGKEVRAPRKSVQFLSRRWSAQNRYLVARSGLDDTLTDGVAHEARSLVNIKLVHQPCAMRFGCFHADTK